MDKCQLLIQCSTGDMRMALVQNDQLLAESSDEFGRNLTAHFENLCAQSGADVSNISSIYADIGPGGLGATRSGVAFANALGFARKIPVVGVSAFQLLGHYVSSQTGKPVICLRPAARPDFHGAEFADNLLSSIRFASGDEIAAWAIDKVTSHAFVGKFNLPQLAEVESLGNTVPMAAFWPAVQAAGLTECQSTAAWPITQDVSVAHG